MSSKPKNNSPSPQAQAALVSKNARYYLYHDVNIIGRNENASVCIQDPTISRQHCTISKLEDKQFTICDTSNSGTFVNNKKLVKNRVQIINHKDTISFGCQLKHVYIFMINRKLTVPIKESEYLNSQMKDKILTLDTSHSMELMKLNIELCKIDSEKCDLRQEMHTRLQDQAVMFNEEKLNLSNLVTITQEQKCYAENKLKEMQEKFQAEENRLKEELESKFAIMVKKEEEIQQLKVEMELKHEKDRKELEDRCQAEIDELKVKLVIAEMEQDRLQEETKDVQQQLEESKKILLESEVEQSRLAEEKEEVETKLIDLTKESTYKDDIVSDLKRQLKEKEKEEERIKKGMEQIEDSLMCSICVELFIQPTVVNCGHMFCKTCIEEWKLKKRICPMCRAKITSCVEVYTLDSVIESHLALLSSDARERREKIISDRKNDNCVHHAKKKKRKYMRANSPYRRLAEVHPTPRSMIPMVQINSALPFFNQPDMLSRRTMFDPFEWPAEERRSTRMEVDDPVAQIDLTSILEPNTPRRQSATVTSGLIDLTTP